MPSASVCPSLCPSVCLSHCRTCTRRCPVVISLNCTPARPSIKLTASQAGRTHCLLSSSIFRQMADSFGARQLLPVCLITNTRQISGCKLLNLSSPLFHTDFRYFFNSLIFCNILCATVWLRFVCLCFLFLVFVFLFFLK